MPEIITNLTDDELRSIVMSLDRVGRSLFKRFEGDDEPLVNLMSGMGLSQNIVDKQLIAGLVMREALHRGLQIPHGN